ncbi:MAG TPA: hypothetical protein VFP72_12805 [Kineosporiaceae bacterium]|nr:hypothetical protein [Kineosporiaceae bacterium]
MFIPLAAPLTGTPAVAASIASSGLPFEALAPLGIAVAVVAALALFRLAAAILPGLVRALVVIGTLILAAGVLSGVVALLRDLYQSRPR